MHTGADRPSPDSRRGKAAREIFPSLDPCPGDPTVLVTYWSAKGGAGATVVAASLALIIGRRNGTGALLADLAGDAPAVLGVPEPRSPGLAGWLAGGPTVPADALARLEVEIVPGVGLLPRGGGRLTPERVHVLAALLAAAPRPVVVDAGLAGFAGLAGAAEPLLTQSDRSILVTRACYLALRRAMRLPQRPTEVVVVREPGRVLSNSDIEHVVRAPVTAEIELDPAVARAVDAGLLAGRIPRSLERPLERSLADAA